MSSRLLLQRLAPRLLSAQQQAIGGGGSGATTTTTVAAAAAAAMTSTSTSSSPLLLQFRRSFAIKSPPGGADDASVPAADDDTHADFRPAYAPPSSPESVKSSIERDIKTHDVFLYMKGDPEAPQCGFSNMACRILDAYGVTYGSRNVLADPALREAIKEFSSWPTIPQCYVKGEFVGGADILMSMHQSGELEKVLEEVSGSGSGSGSGSSSCGKK